jgi:formylglycine-generating enzyme required for sulfatase activity
MGETEVTQELFEAVMGTNPSLFQGSSYPPAAGETQAKRPVERVSWYEAITFCNKLSLLDGKEPVYSVSEVSDWANLAYSDIPTPTTYRRDSMQGREVPWSAPTRDIAANGYRLPTIMERLWAAMGADKTAQPNTTGIKKRFPGSNWEDYMWDGDNSGDKTHEVGKKLPNELNLYDMDGNVNEWVWDRLGNYWDLNGELTDHPSASSDSLELIGGRFRRGTNYRSGGAFSLDTRGNSGDSNPAQRFDGVGFRLVCSQ